MSAGLPAASLGRFPVTAAVSFPGAVVAITGSGCVRLLDGATAWTPAACPPGAFRESAAVGSARLVRTGSSLSVSSDGGDSWTPAASGLPVLAAPVAASLFWNGARFATTDTDVLLIADAGAGFRAYRFDAGAWTALATPFPDGVTWTGFLTTPDGTLYGGTFGRGLWRFGGAVSAEAARVAALALDAPYPNPAHGSVRVRYALPAAMQATVAVFDGLGRRVAVLTDGWQDAGPHDAEWSAAAAAGTYVVRLTTSAGTAAHRVTVVR